MDQEFIALGALKRIVPTVPKSPFKPAPLLRIRQQWRSNEAPTNEATVNDNYSRGSDSPTNDMPTQLSPPSQSDETPSYGDTKEELQQAIEGSNDVLVRANTAFTLISDKVVLDRAKLTITRRNFFNSAEIMSIRIEDVLNVTATVGPILGSVKIMSRVLNADPYVVGRFLRQDALKIKRITQGYIIALQREIDCNAIPTRELIEMLDRLGEDEHVPRKWKTVIRV